jgi:hypothetical protein
MERMFCENCGREVFGFWKYGKNHTCSMKCFRKMIKDGRISQIPPYVAFPELNISAPRKDQKPLTK